MFIFSELIQRNIKSITELDLLELSVYFVETWFIDVDNPKLKELANFLRVLVWIEYSSNMTTVKFTNSGLSFSISLFIFIFILFYFSIFLFLEQLGLGFISHAVTSVTTWWHSHKTDHETWENLVEDSRTDNVIQHGHHMLAS